MESDWLVPGKDLKPPGSVLAVCATEPKEENSGFSFH